MFQAIQSSKVNDMDHSKLLQEFTLTHLNSILKRFNLLIDQITLVSLEGVPQQIHKTSPST